MVPLRLRVELLLKTESAETVFASSEVTQAMDAPPSASGVRGEVPGARIGPYKLLHVIGAGGMGMVCGRRSRSTHCAATSPPQDHQGAGYGFGRGHRPFRSRTTGPGHDGNLNIAKVLDAGTTQSGRPYFVMELVGGERPLTSYMAMMKRSKERLELLIPVCRGIQHAHQNGIIHRDIAYRNVLLFSYDGVPTSNT